MRLSSGRREKEILLAQGGPEGQKASRGGVAMGGRLLYRGIQANVNLWSSGERMLTIGRTPVCSETRPRVWEIATRDAAAHQRIYADDGGMGRLKVRDLCDWGRLLRGSSPGSGE